jgi:hypothetical protein
MMVLMIGVTAFALKIMKPEAHRTALQTCLTGQRDLALDSNPGGTDETSASVGSMRLLKGDTTVLCAHWRNVD